MSRLEIPDPSPVIYSRVVKVTDEYINEARHIGNESYVLLLNKTAENFFRDQSLNPYSVGGQLLLNTEFSVQLKSEVRLDALLNIELGVKNFHRCGCDFIYRINDTESDRLVARARFSFLTFDYQVGKVCDAADGFEAFFTG